MRARRRLLGAGLAVAALVAGAVTGCGIPTEDSATLAPAEDVPFDLLAEVPETTSSTLPSPAGSSTAQATIFLVQGERLAPVVRDVPAPATGEGVLEALERGPTRSEAALGLRSALVGRDVMRSIGISGGIASVDLGPDFTDIVGRDQIMALAQIVSTVTGLAGVGRVSFTLEGVPVGVPRGDGAVTTESVSRDDYALLAPVPLG
ncbi:MAG: GerMN domain-containing protein [Acidimicrobiia bacterium]